MKDFLQCGALLMVVFVAFGLPVGLIITGYDSIVVENIMLVKAAFVAWFLAIIVLASAGNK